MIFLLYVLVSFFISLGFTKPLPLTKPFMGWMAWQQFRCTINCNATDYNCVNERLLLDHGRILNESGLLNLGYNRVHVDDCAVANTRDPITHILPLDPTRFPSGLEGVSIGLHNYNINFGVYTAESYTTCEGFSGSRGYENIDVSNWGDVNVDYIKADGCGDSSYFPIGYPILGSAINNYSNTNIIYSCSWPAYDGEIETSKNWTAYMEAGCNTGRTFADMQCAWDSPPPLGGTPLLPIIDHYGDYSAYLQSITTQMNFVMDPDVLLAGATNPDNGAPCLTFDQERTQMAIYCILAFPLVLGNDLRNMSNTSKSIIMNPSAIAINQDGGVIGGRRISPKGALEIWVRNLTDGSKAVGLFNKYGEIPSECPVEADWIYTGPNWFYEAGMPCGSPNGNTVCFDNTTTIQDAIALCCNDINCAGFSYNIENGGGCFKTNQTCPYNSTGYEGYFKPSSLWPPAPPPNNGLADITVNFQDIGFNVSQYDKTNHIIQILDVWAETVIANLTLDILNYTYPNIALHNTAFLRISIVEQGM